MGKETNHRKFERIPWVEVASGEWKCQEFGDKEKLIDWEDNEKLKALWKRNKPKSDTEELPSIEAEEQPAEALKVSSKNSSDTSTPETMPPREKGTNIDEEVLNMINFYVSNQVAEEQIYILDPDFDECVIAERVNKFIKQTMELSNKKRQSQKDTFNSLIQAAPTLENIEIYQCFNKYSHKLTLMFADYAEKDSPKSDKSLGLDQFLKELKIMGIPLTQEQQDKLKDDFKPLYIKVKNVLSKTDNEPKSGILTKLISSVKGLLGKKEIKSENKSNDLDSILYEIQDKFDNVQSIFKESSRSTDLTTGNLQPSLLLSRNKELSAGNVISDSSIGG